MGRISFEDIRNDHDFPSADCCGTTARTVSPIEVAAARAGVAVLVLP